jgi:hypothetical protein
MGSCLTNIIGKLKQSSFQERYANKTIANGVGE